MGYRVVTPPSQTAVQTWEVTVPGGQLWRVESITVHVFASVVAGPHFPRVYVTNGTTTLFAIDSTKPLGASQDCQCTWVRATIGLLDTTSPFMSVMPFPPYPLPAGYVIGFSINDAGPDLVWDRPAIWVDDLLLPAVVPPVVVGGGGAGGGGGGGGGVPGDVPIPTYQDGQPIDFFDWTLLFDPIGVAAPPNVPPR